MRAFRAAMSRSVSASGGFPFVSLINDDPLLINLALEIFINGKIVPLVKDRRVAADARVALRRFFHLEINVDIAPRIAERRDAAAEDDNLLDVRIALADLDHPPDVRLLRREDARDVRIRFCKCVPRSQKCTFGHHHHLIPHYPDARKLSFARNAIQFIKSQAQHHSSLFARAESISSGNTFSPAVHQTFRNDVSPHITYVPDDL